MSAPVTRVVGVDPGTLSFDVCGLEDGRVFLDRSFATPELGDDPGALVGVLRDAGPLDLVVGPSGYGLPWTAAADVSPRELALMVLAEAQPGADTVIRGMGRLLRALAESGLPVCFAPSVVQLASVPAHRKVNRIDMGTADKVCAAALGVWDQARRLGLEHAQTSFVFVEAGGAFTAVLAVRDGAVVDGAGGTAGSLGFGAAGALDGEVAYLLGGFAKGRLAGGGVAAAAGAPEATPQELTAAAASDVHAALAWEAFFEGVEKQVAALVAAGPAPREVLLSGRLCRLPWIEERLAARLARFAPVRRVQGPATVAKEAAQGAALLADGLAGGDSAALVAAMRLRDAGGTVLDHVVVDGMDEVRRRFRAFEPDPAPFWERRTRRAD